ncbi:MAG TPA: hypothetical protein EYP87_08060 [Flavobacteriaceae bacterium]|nr:hypothetical protein [Flavobacteriaceae bacterium]
MTIDGLHGKYKVLDEMKSTSWLIKNNSYSNILSVAAKSFWRNELIKSGGEYQIWANSPEDPNMN